MDNLNPEFLFSDNYTTSNPIIKKLQKRFFDNIFSIIEKNKINPQAILELGAGEGFSTEKLIRFWEAKKFFVSSDLHFELVKKNADKSSCDKMVVFDINRPPIVYKKMDFVIALEVLEHIPNPDNALKEVAKLTKVFALISVPFEPWWRIGNMLRGAYIKDFGNTPDHVNHWSIGSFKNFLSKQFKNVEIKISFPWLIGICSHEIK